MDSAKLRSAKEKVGNTFKLTVLLQKRCQELVGGARPLVEERFKSPIETALEEIVQGKIWLDSLPDVLAKRRADAAAEATAAGA